eukprot:scaffold12537_cov72-Phaeocystis_antarctica.AAC.3
MVKGGEIVAGPPVGQPHTGSAEPARAARRALRRRASRPRDLRRLHVDPAVLPQVTAIDGDSLAVAQHADVVGDHLVRVRVGVGVGGDEEQLACADVGEPNLPRLWIRTLGAHEGRRLPGARRLGALAVVAADRRSHRRVGTPPQSVGRRGDARACSTTPHQPRLFGWCDPERQWREHTGPPPARVAALRALRLHEPRVAIALPRECPVRALLVLVDALGLGGKGGVELRQAREHVGEARVGVEAARAAGEGAPAPAFAAAAAPCWLS